jgi:hypothetical protein
MPQIRLRRQPMISRASYSLLNKNPNRFTLLKNFGSLCFLMMDVTALKNASITSNNE